MSGSLKFVQFQFYNFFQVRKKSLRSDISNYSAKRSFPLFFRRSLCPAAYVCSDADDDVEILKQRTVPLSLACVPRVTRQHATALSRIHARRSESNKSVIAPLARLSHRARNCRATRAGAINLHHAATLDKTQVTD